MAKRVEENFISDAEYNVQYQIKYGVLLMESSLAINGKNSYHNVAMESYSTAVWNEYRKKHFWFCESMNHALIILSVIPLLLGLPIWYSLVDNSTNLSFVGKFIFDFAIIIILVGLAFLLLLLINILSARKKRLSVCENVQIEANGLKDEELLNYCNSIYFSDYLFTNYLTNIALKMGIDPQSAKEYLGRVRGGGSTYYGFGSGGAVGLGIGLSAISKMRAASANSYVNSRIKNVELYVFYANIAHHFNVNMRKFYQGM
jgi:hypothetical protein